MFRRLPEVATGVSVEVDGVPIAAAEGDSVAAVLLAAGLLPFRCSLVTGEPRAPFCMIGNCFECLLEIDGVPNRQSCMVTVQDGMRIRRPLVPPMPGTGEA